MPTDRSDAAYEYWRESSEKFDYFVTGLTGALAAYIGQTLLPVRLGINPQTLELISLGCLVASVLFGFIRIEKNVTILRVQSQRLYAEEARGSLTEAAQNGPALNAATGEIVSTAELRRRATERSATIELAESTLTKLSESSARFYSLRDSLLFVGFLLLVIAKILPAYLPHAT
jgi:hypothetical protein